MTPERAGRPLLLIDLAVPRDIDPACAELPGVTLYDVDDLQRQVARHQRVRRAEARRAEGIVEEEIQAFAGWLGSLEVMPTLTALRTRADDVVTGLLAENEGRWESLSDADRERVEKLARTAVVAAAARADGARAPARRRAPPRAAVAAARAVRARRAGGGRAQRWRRGPPAAPQRRQLTALRVGTRGSALALAQARWVAERLADAEIVEITTSGDRARGVGDKSRWVDTIEAALVAGEIDLAVHSAKDVPAELAEGCALVATPPRAAAEDDARSAAPEGPAPAALRRRRAGRDLVAAAARAAAGGAPGSRGRRAARQRRHAVAQARRGRGRRHRPRRRGPRAARARPSARRSGLRARARARGRWRSRRGRMTSGCGRRWRWCMTRTPSPPSTPSGPPCASWTRLVTRPWESTRKTARFAGFVGLPDGSAWVADELDGQDGEELARRMLAAGAGELLAQAEAMA